MTTSPRKLIAAFGRFWWDFLIGENPDAFIAAIVIIGVALLLRHERAAAIAVVPLLAVFALVASTYRGRQHS